LEIAREEASRLGHDFIGTEHVLLAVLRLAEGGVVNVLQNSKVDRESVRMEIERLVATQPGHTPTATLPLTPRARKALQFAASEAETLKNPLINADHILLGLLREGGGVAAQALKNLGIRLERIRAGISKPSA
jgi:ATP-dependent Clp protease ATP-binding subunit ClpC